jgi:hypothetical protein
VADEQVDGSRNLVEIVDTYQTAQIGVLDALHVRMIGDKGGRLGTIRNGLQDPRFQGSERAQN